MKKYLSVLLTVCMLAAIPLEVFATDGAEPPYAEDELILQAPDEILPEAEPEDSLPEPSPEEEPPAAESDLTLRAPDELLPEADEEAEPPQVSLEEEALPPSPETVPLQEDAELQPEGQEAVTAATDYTYNGIHYTVDNQGNAIITGCNSDIANLVIPPSINGHAVTAIQPDAFRGNTMLAFADIADVYTVGRAAFMDCAGLRRITFRSNHGINFGAGAFQNCTGLSHLDIPSISVWLKNTYANATANPDYYGNMYINGSIFNETSLLVGANGSIPNYAFINNTELENVYIEEGCTSIGVSAFEGSSVYNLHLPSSLKTIKVDAVKDCPFLNTIYANSIEDWLNMDVVGAPLRYADKLVANMKTVTGHVQIPEGITNIRPYVFTGLKGITHISLPESLQTISASAFNDMDDLEFIHIPAGVTSVGTNAFSSCDKLSVVLFDGSQPQLGKGLFIYCNRVNVGYPSTGGWNADSLPPGAYWHATEPVQKGLSFGNKYGDLSVNAYYGSQPHVDIPAEVAGLTVTSIADKAFFGSDIQSITLPDTMKQIGESAFSWCRELTEITLPNSVETLGEAAFASALKLERVVLPNQLRSIPTLCFQNCSALQAISIPASMQSMGTNCFGQTASLQRIDYASWDSFLNIDYAHSTANPAAYCTGPDDHKVYVAGQQLKDHVIVPDGVTRIPPYSFSGIAAISEITLPDSLTELTKAALADCGGLRTVHLPAQLTTIGENAFSECRKLTFPDLPESLTSIGKNAFYSCNSFTQVVIPDHVTQLGDGMLKFCSQLESCTLPNGLTDLPPRILSNCPKLSKVDIPASLRTVGSGAFADTALAEITLPAQIESIEAAAFYNCQSLNSVTFTGNPPIFAEDAFSQSHPTVYYPDSNPMWTANVMRQYGGNLNWQPYAPDPIPDGWSMMDGFWVYGENGHKVTNRWMLDSQGWCYLGIDGYMVSSDWVQDSGGWCYLGENGHIAENLWTMRQGKAAYAGDGGRLVKDAWLMKDGHWVKVDNQGYLMTDTWAEDSHGRVYLNENGFMLKNYWLTDASGICYLNADGYLVRDAWLMKNGSWVKAGSDGYLVTDCWMADSHGWVYLDSQGDMVKNAWVEDSHGPCYAGSDGYVVTDTWRMYDGEWAQIDGEGHLTGEAFGFSLVSGAAYIDYYQGFAASITIPESIDVYTVAGISPGAFGGHPQITEITFTGDPIDLASDAFLGVTAQVHYPLDNPAWTDNLKQNYGGHLTWVEAPSFTEGWNLVDGKWCYIEGGQKVTERWMLDSQGWCYLGADGFLVTDTWQMDSQGWCYLDDSGHIVTNAWKQDSHGWVYLDENGRMVYNCWQQDSSGWVWIGADGYAT